MNITAANLQDLLNNIVTANEGEKIKAIEAMINELIDIKEICETEEAIIEAQNELVNLESVSIGDIPDEDFAEFVKSHKAAVSAAKQKIYTLRISLFDKGIPPFLLNPKVWSMNEVVKKCSTQYE